MDKSTNTRWILCSERLPKQSGEYMTTSELLVTDEEFTGSGYECDDTCMITDRMRGYRLLRFVGSWTFNPAYGWYFASEAAKKTWKIIAWEPLPEMYTEDINNASN